MVDISLLHLAACGQSKLNPVCRMASKSATLMVNGWILFTNLTIIRCRGWLASGIWRFQRRVDALCAYRCSRCGLVSQQNIKVEHQTTRCFPKKQPIEGRVNE